MADFLRRWTTKIVTQSWMPDEDHRQIAPATGDDLHQSLQSVEGSAMQVMGFIDEQSDRLAGANHELS